MCVAELFQRRRGAPRGYVDEPSGRPGNAIVGLVDEPSDSCPVCGADLYVSRVRFVDSAGYTPPFPSGTVGDTAECCACDTPFLREEGGAWRRMSHEERAADRCMDQAGSEEFHDNIEATFPGRYAGTWTDPSTYPAKLCIGLVDGTPTDRERMLGFFALAPDRLMLVPTRYSLAELDAFKDAVSEVIHAYPDKKWTTIMCGAHAPENRVTVKMNARDPVLEARLRAAVPADVLEVTVDPTFSLGHPAKVLSPGLESGDRGDGD